LIFKYSGLLRLARLSRAIRIARLLRGNKRGALIADVVKNRSNYAAGITVLMTLIILTTSSVLVLQFESQSPDATITTGWDAFWYSIVTITTVGYGDYFPVTVWGRVTAMFIMITGVGIIGVLASLMSSILIGTPPASKTEPDSSVQVTSPSLEAEIAEIKKNLAEITEIKSELAEMRKLLENYSGASDRD
jgi:voltage-gated potassium channel